MGSSTLCGIYIFLWLATRQSTQSNSYTYVCTLYDDQSIWMDHDNSLLCSSGSGGPLLHVDNLSILHRIHGPTSYTIPYWSGIVARVHYSHKLNRKDTEEERNQNQIPKTVNTPKYIRRREGIIKYTKEHQRIHWFISHGTMRWTYTHYVVRSEVHPTPRAHVERTKRSESKSQMN